MKKSEVITLIGQANYPLFQKFMRGQTVELCKDGSIDYYETDVQRFIKIYGIRQ